jgi:sacsin
MKRLLTEICRERALKRCDLTGDKYSLMVPKDLPALPQIQDVAFFDLSSPSERYLVESFTLLETPSLESLLETHLLPWVVSADEGFDTVKDGLIDFIFSNEHSTNPSESWIKLVANKPLIPIVAHGKNRRRRRQCIVDLVRPQTLLSKLYFEHEGVSPEPGFFKKHKAALISCDIKSKPTSADLVSRIYYFSQCPVDAQELVEKVKILLSMPPPLELISDELSRNRIRKLKWLPGIPVTGNQFSLLSPQECRGPDQQSLTNYVMGTTTLSSPRNWEKVLGWDEPIPRKLLYRQLDICLENNDHDKVNQILSYLKPHEYPDIQVKKCILGSRKDYRNANESFLPNSLLSKYPMFPYLDEVDSHFAQLHPMMMEVLKVRREPSITDLIQVGKHLQASAPTLKESDLDVAVSSLEIAGCLFKTEELTEILIPDSQNVLRNLWDIVHGDRNVTGAIAAFHYTHSMISANVIERLGVENSLARATRLAIEFEDEDDDEYTLEEKLTDIISDTLARYSMPSTFNEYLANADDCGATEISWILDECENGRYASKALLTPELEAFQGPALIVHNDESESLPLLCRSTGLRQDSHRPFF